MWPMADAILCRHADQQLQTNMTMAMSFRFLSDVIYFTHHSMELQQKAQRVSLAILQVFPT
jgi:hypothetical protein